MNIFSLNDLELSYLDAGSGFPLVLIHGMGSDHNIWAGIIPLLKENYRVLAVDLRGHGCSSKTRGPNNMEIFSTDIQGFLESLDIKKAHFIGHSMGGAVLLEMAINNPDIMSSLTLISSFAYPDYQLKKSLINLRNTLNEQGYNEFFDECIKIAHNPQYVKENRELLNKFRKEMAKTSSIPSLISTIYACLNVNYRDSLKNILTPTLIIAGEEDQFISKDQGIKISKSIPQSKFNLVSGASHNMVVEEPLKIYNIIKTFLEKYN
jgi:3-oxoadipate enol-lactonase